MKKSLFFCVFVVFILSLSAQTVKPLYPNVAKSGWFYNFKTYPMDKGDGNEDENQYVFRDNFDEFIVYTINKSGKVSASPVVEIPDDYRLRNQFQTNNEIVAIYSIFSKGLEKYYINTCDKKKMSWKPEQLTTMDCEKKDNCYSSVSVSPNKSHFCIMGLTTDKKKNFKDMLVMVFDAQGQKIWENAVAPDFSNKTFEITDITITDQGVVYLCIHAYSGEKKKTYDEKVYIIEVKETDFMQVETSKSIGYITAAGMTLLKNGNVFVGGYYSEKMNDNVKGSFSIMFNPKEQTIGNFSNQDFPASFSKNDIESLGFDRIIELSNGRIVLLGEQLTVVQYYSQNGGSSYKYYAKNIIYTAFSSNGDIETHKIIGKNQTFASFVRITDFKRLCLSFDAFEKNGGLYLIFNDHVGNINSTKKTLSTINPIMQKGKCIVKLVKIDGDNESSQIVFDGKTNKKSMHTFLFAEDNSILFFNLGKTVSLDKVNINYK
jgi:hypothetical protein